MASMRGAHKSGGLQCTLRGLLILMTAVACVFGLARFLARWFDDYGDLVVATLIAVLPLCFLIERVFSGPPISQPAEAAHWRVWRHLAIVAAAFTTAVAAWIGSSAGVPKLCSPLPYLVVLPLMCSESWILAMVIPVVTFLMLNLYLGRAATPCPIPARFLVLLVVATAFSILWFALGVRYSYGYHGPTFTIGITIINSSIMLALWVFWFFIRRRANFWFALGWSLALHCWLFWCAFPWLGELI